MPWDKDGRLWVRWLVAVLGMLLVQVPLETIPGLFERYPLLTLILLVMYLFVGMPWVLIRVL